MGQRALSGVREKGGVVEEGGLGVAGHPVHHRIREIDPVEPGEAAGALSAGPVIHVGEVDVLLERLIGSAQRIIYRSLRKAMGRA